MQYIIDSSKNNFKVFHDKLEYNILNHVDLKNTHKEYQWIHRKN